MAKDWGLYEDEGNVKHVIPHEDEIEHSYDLIFPIEPSQWFKDNLEKDIVIVDAHIEFTSDCPCKPRIEYITEKSSWMIVHDALDGRLGVEWANQILASPLQ